MLYISFVEFYGVYLHINGSERPYGKIIILMMSLNRICFLNSLRNAKICIMHYVVEFIKDDVTQFYQLRYKAVPQQESLFVPVPFI